jgi:hypothetical protein
VPSADGADRNPSRATHRLAEFGSFAGKHARELGDAGSRNPACNCCQAERGNRATGRIEDGNADGIHAGDNLALDERKAATPRLGDLGE